MLVLNLYVNVIIFLINNGYELYKYLSKIFFFLIQKDIDPDRNSSHGSDVVILSDLLLKTEQTKTKMKSQYCSLLSYQSTSVKPRLQDSVWSLCSPHSPILT